MDGTSLSVVGADFSRRYRCVAIPAPLWTADGGAYPAHNVKLKMVDVKVNGAGDVDEDPARLIECANPYVAHHFKIKGASDHNIRVAGVVNDIAIMNSVADTALESDGDGLVYDTKSAGTVQGGVGTLNNVLM